MLGKYAGLVLTLAVNLAVMAAALYARARRTWRGRPGRRAAAGVGASGARSGAAQGVRADLRRAALVTAIALFFSTFSTPLLSAALTFGFFVAGRFSADLRNFNQVVESPAAAAFARGLYWVLPNLAPFDVRAQVVHGQPVTAGYIALTAGYGALYVARCIVAATLIFSRRDFK